MMQHHSLSEHDRTAKAIRIDLHTHSNASDGTQPPGELMRVAKANGLDVIALTDHDTTAGWSDAAQAAVEVGIMLVPGIEVSTKLGPASVHVLAYLPDPEHPALIEVMERVRQGRVHRAERIVAALAADFPLTWEDVLAVSEPGATIGRPHIADALVARGIVPSRSEAFASVLHVRGKYYVPHESPHPVDAIELIAAAGAVPVLAHGGSRGAVALNEPVFTKMVAAGLAGVEIRHRENDAHAREQLANYARRWDLIVTGSSDYHGAGKPNELGENTTDPEQLTRILQAGTGTDAVNSTVVFG